MESEPLFPTESALAALSPWARIAYAARCARRVQPLANAWPGRAPALREAIERAIALAEEAAARADASATGAAVRAAAGRAANDAAEELRRAAQESDGDSSRAAFAALSAAKAAVRASRGSPDPAAVADAAFEAEASAGPAFWAVQEAMRRDFEKLQSWASPEKMFAPEPVAVSVFGPLWPDGEPSAWREAIRRVAQSDQSAG
jgi:hypothetical protein